MHPDGAGIIRNRAEGEGSGGGKPVEAGEIRDESVLLHQPDAPLIEWLDQRLQGRPRSIHQALFKWDPEMFCRHQFWGVGQREDQPDAWRNHHPGTAVPPCVINDQDQQTLVCWIEPSLEEAQCGTERSDIDSIEPQQIRSPRERMDEAIDVRPFEPIGVGCGRPHPTLGPAAPQHAFRAKPCFILKPQLVRAIRVEGFQIVDECLDFFLYACCCSGVAAWE